MSSGATHLNFHEFDKPNHFADMNASVDLEMIWVEPGTFTMGSPENELYRDTSETEHNVTLTRGFYLGKYEVTQAQYEALINAGPPVYDLNASAAKELTFNGYRGFSICECRKLHHRKRDQ